MKQETLTVIGESPLAVDGGGNLISRIGTLFVKARVLITLPLKTHALQRKYYFDLLKEACEAEGRPPPDEGEVLVDAVDLIMGNAAVQIREDDPSRMGQAFEADDLLQGIVPKQRIRFLHARKKAVQEAIRMRGEYWRISPHPKKIEDVVSAIGQSKIALGGLPIYYYSPVTGTRYLTRQAFSDLGGLAEEPLRLHLTEIQAYLKLRNRHYNLEVAFFGLKPGCRFSAEAFQAYDFTSGDEGTLRRWHRELCEAFGEAVEETLLRDDVTHEFWRNRMFACLMDERNETLAEKLVSGLSEEFFRQIEWLPGGRVENKELIFDPIFDDPKAVETGLCDSYVKGFIFNYVREFGDLECVNIGRLLPGLRNRPAEGAHRAYLAEVKHRNAPETVLRILRVQRWGIKEHLENFNGDLLHAIMETQDYTEYTLDRRLGCWELGLPLAERYDMKIIPDEYIWNERPEYVSRIWVTYYERDFIEGLATDKVSTAQLQDPAFAIPFARLLGRAAAPNMIVGRTTAAKEEKDCEVIFDQGDEMLRLDDKGLPTAILVADHAGTFNAYKSPLLMFADAYARPVLSRLSKIPKPDQAKFIASYLSSMEEQLVQMQEKYSRYRQGFDGLFRHSKQAEESFADRWRHVLDRLWTTNMKAVVEKIGEAIEAHKNA
ncbi:MAG: hypothetical protein FWG50_01795 [Kiritimatiellaeota bacterium]|nr:hypothetical protein [Kiritimatiellota bacterium]